MKLMLDNIVKECLKRGISVDTSIAPDGSLSYDVDGFSKSGTAKLYLGDDCVICETRYDQVDHVLTFSDLAFIAHDWFLNYKDKEPFTTENPQWVDSFNELYIGVRNSPSGEDLPF